MRGGATRRQVSVREEVYEANCITCHLPDLDGSANPDAGAGGALLVGTRFVQDFGESKVSALFNKMKRDMPSGRPGTLTDQEYLDAASYVLQRNRFPAGATELTAVRSSMVSAYREQRPVAASADRGEGLGHGGRTRTSVRVPPRRCSGWFRRSQKQPHSRGLRLATACARRTAWARPCRFLEEGSP
ncbi:MAG: hypothetical protein EHM55_00080 [Acidobacteria bacterium]|nr:MAG: hypothetical protein EHM55_00080 [Acidobacteriota bacterium]